MPKSTRRALLKAAGAAGAVSLSGCVGTLPVVGGGKSQLTKYAEQVREQTAKYDGDRKAAIEDGYKQVFGPLVPGQGWHFQNPAFAKKAVKNGEFKIDEPPILGYDTNGNIGYVEYGAPTPTVSQQPSLFSDISEPPSWAVHKTATHVYADENEEVVPAPQRPLDEIMTPEYWTEFNPPNPDIEPGDEVTLSFGADSQKETRVADFVVTHPDLTSLHFWVHEENPEGIFAPVHPDFAQP